MIWMVVSGAVFLAIPEVLLGVFHAEPGVAEIARSVLMLYALIQSLDAVAAIVCGGLSGAGDTTFVLRTSLATAWLGKLPVGAALVACGLGALGAWIGVSVEIAATAAIVIWRVSGDRWLGEPVAAATARAAPAK